MCNNGFTKAGENIFPAYERECCQAKSSFVDTVTQKCLTCKSKTKLCVECETGTGKCLKCETKSSGTKISLNSNNQCVYDVCTTQQQLGHPKYDCECPTGFTDSSTSSQYPVSCVANIVCVDGEYFNRFDNKCYSCGTGCESCSLKNPTDDDAINPVLKCDKCKPLYAFDT